MTGSLPYSLKSLDNFESSKEIFLLWIYSHEMFAKRPPDKDLRNLIKTVLEVE